MVDCIFCAIVSGQVQSFKLYEDQDIVAILDIFPATPGHTLIFPRQHIQSYLQVPDSVIGKMFVLAKYISIATSSVLKAQGVNLYLASGELAGQRVPHIVLHVIPKYKEDGLKFEWERKQVDSNTLSQIHQSLVAYLNQSRIQVQNAQSSPQQVQQKLPQKQESNKKENNKYEKMFYWFLRKR